MAKEKATDMDFDLGFTPDQWEQTSADQGVGFSRVKFGDYTFEVTGVEIQTSKNPKNPHNMLKVTSRVTGAADAANKTEIGSEITNLYAGSPQSPEYMKKRLKAFGVACGVAPTKTGGLKGSAFIGKRFDASVVWELSKSDKLDDFGRNKWFVNARLKGERKVGGERPPGLNPAAESAKAEKHLLSGEPGDVGGGDTAPWENVSATVENPAEPATGGFIDESEVDSLGHLYRAVYKLGGEQSDQAKEALVASGIDPEGPVKPELIEDPEVRKAYEAKFVPVKSNGLPPMKPRTGTRAPAQAR